MGPGIRGTNLKEQVPIIGLSTLSIYAMAAQGKFDETKLFPPNFSELVSFI